jgi:hypothetical protein
MPAGRPSLYDPSYCETVVELGREGKSPAQIAARLDVARSTLIEWASMHPEFSTALTRAKTLEQNWWEEQGQIALTSDRFNSAVWSKSMSARFREDYTERQSHEHAGKDGAPINTRLTIEFVTAPSPGKSEGGL